MTSPALGAGYFSRVLNPTLLILTSTSGLPRGSAPLGSHKDRVVAGRTCPLARDLCFWGPQKGMLAVMSGLGRLYREESGSATLMPHKWQQQQREFFQSTWFSCMMHSYNSPFGCDF